MIIYYQSPKLHCTVTAKWKSMIEQRLLVFWPRRIQHYWEKEHQALQGSGDVKERDSWFGPNCLWGNVLFPIFRWYKNIIWKKSLPTLSLRLELHWSMKYSLQQNLSEIWVQVFLIQKCNFFYQTRWSNFYSCMDALHVIILVLHLVGHINKISIYLN